MMKWHRITLLMKTCPFICSAQSRSSAGKGNLQFRVEVNERSGGWMTDDASFWKRWNNPVTVYMLTEQGTYDKLRSESSFKFRLVAQGLYDVLLSNKTT